MTVARFSTPVTLKKFSSAHRLFSHLSQHRRQGRAGIQPIFLKLILYPSNRLLACNHQADLAVEGTRVV